MQIQLSAVISAVHFEVVCLISWISTVCHFLQNWIFTFTTSMVGYPPTCYKNKNAEEFLLYLSIVHTHSILTAFSYYLESNFFFTDKE